ncbi:hypothetical protein G6F50_014840 [Rhizopus delemar]|uniref:Uncharacterized protein n=1 Tax=Rhizopus delemar TaxID=936053 RepID=A0A9P6Y1X8_9FUNG|nr:hypothetical protein G6F50_014840 [Rhizopus delemar]
MARREGGGRQGVGKRQHAPGRGTHQHAVAQTADVTQERGIEQQHPQRGDVGFRAQVGAVRGGLDQTLAFLRHAHGLRQQAAVVPGKPVVDLVDFDQPTGRQSRQETQRRHRQDYSRNSET